MDDWRIEEYELGAPDGIQVRAAYNVEINLDNGQIYNEFVTYQKVNVHLRSGRCSWYTNNGHVESYVSAEHARKLAAELRQYWLRAGKPEASNEVAGKIFEPSEAL